MTSRASTLRLVLSIAACSVVLVACGNGLTFGIAPGGPPPPEPPKDAGPIIDPPAEDAGEDPPPPPDAGSGCITTTVPLSPDDDLSEFSSAGIATFFSTGPNCKTCHSGRNPEGQGLTWGATEDAEEAWFEAVSALLTLPRNDGLPFEQTTLYAAFNGTAPAPYTGQHPNNDAAKAALEAWLSLREEGITETVCTDAGPGPTPGTDAGPGPGPDCTPTIPTESESEAKFIALNLGTTFALCNACHVGSTKQATATLQAWGAKENTPAGWHVAFWGKAKQENFATDVTQSVLYTHFNGYDGTHAVRATERDSTEEWLEYALNGEVPAGCP